MWFVCLFGGESTRMGGCQRISTLQSTDTEKLSNRHIYLPENLPGEIECILCVHWWWGLEREDQGNMGKEETGRTEGWYGNPVQWKLSKIYESNPKETSK